jgi:hypothetical protein
LLFFSKNGKVPGDIFTPPAGDHDEPKRAEIVLALAEAVVAGV